MIEVILYGGHVALIDDEDAPLIIPFSWYRNDNGYAKRNSTLGSIYMHRVVMPGYDLVDHRNRNRLDNRRENLRPATVLQNNRNQQLRRDNTTGYRGVGFDRRKGLWRARIVLSDSRRKFLGYFDDPLDAAMAYDEVARVHFGEFAVLNFPERADEEEVAGARG